MFTLGTLLRAPSNGGSLTSESSPRVHARRKPGQHSMRRRRAPPAAAASQDQLLRVYAATDLHVDYKENMDWCRSIDDLAHRGDVLVVSGDVSDELMALEQALGCLAAKFAAVVYCVGNHELWIRKKDRASGVADSVSKLRCVLDLCRRLGVHTQPIRVGNLWLAPLYSWHHKSFDCEADIPGVPPASAWTIADYTHCVWPPNVPGGQELGSLELAQWFDGLNDTPAWHQLLSSRHECDVIALAHFLPHQALLPEKRYLYYPPLAKAVGSVPLAARLAVLQPDLCFVGHTHFAWDTSIGGVRYIQAPLCAPRERQRRLPTVGFGTSMERAEAEPLAARWLPLEVYRCLVPDGWIEELKRHVSGSHAVLSMPVGGSFAGQQPQRGSNQADQAQPQQQSPQQQQHPQQQQSPHVQLQVQEQQQQMLDGWAAEGWQRLRHGAAVPALHARWSDYYAAEQRRPQDIEMAPWVQKVYAKRFQRAARLAAAATSSSDDAEPELGAT